MQKILNHINVKNNFYLLLVLLFCTINLFANNLPPNIKRYDATTNPQLNANLNQELIIQGDNTYYSDGSKLINQNTFIRFGIKGLPEDTYLSGFTANIKLKITPILLNGNDGQSYSRSLKIKFDPNLGVRQHTDLDVIKLINSRGAKVYIENFYYIFNRERYLGNPGNVYLELEHQAERYCITDIDAIPTNFTAQLYNAGSEILFSWDNPENSCVEEYELEWTWVDDYETDANQIKFNVRDFELNNSRVRLDKLIVYENNIYTSTTQNYKIATVFAKGYVLFRIRKIGRFLENVNKNYYGSWSFVSDNENLNVADWPNNTSSLRIINAHEADTKNWQYQTSYAENGKKKEVVSYFDGTLRNRQTVTRINTPSNENPDGKIVVGEVIYDNQGRPAIEVLPVPIYSDNKIKFYDNQNLNNSNIYTHNNFDWDIPTQTCGSIADMMDTSSGASRYYSLIGNSDSQLNWQKNVPDAEQYPFSQIEYTPDNTGRINRKSGVGLTHQLGSSNEMKYLYLTPYQEELNRLFGYNVGNALHYKKNMVVDPNKQVSVSYIDPQGRTIATALVGNNPINENSEDLLLGLDDENNDNLHNQFKVDVLNKLYSNDADTNIDNNLRYNEGNINGLRVSRHIGVASEGAQFTFDYKLNTDVNGNVINPLLQFNPYYPEGDGCGGPYPFIYDIKISLKDDCAIEKLNEGINSDETAEHFTFNETKALEIGTYTLSKDLKINNTILNQYADDYVEKLTDSTSNCYIAPNLFAPNAIFDTCAITCDNCVVDLVSQYSDVTFDPNLTIEDVEGDISTAKTNYISLYTSGLDNNNQPLRLIDITGDSLKQNGPGEPDFMGVENWLTLGNTTSETRQLQDFYVQRFEREFDMIIEACTAPCGNLSSFTTCAISNGFLTQDMSPSGQYGNITFVPVDNDGDDIFESSEITDPTSIFNENNELIFFNYDNNDNPILSSDGEPYLIRYNWRDADYKDENGSDYRVYLEMEIENSVITYYPEFLDDDPNLIHTDPEGLKYIYPQDIKYIKDFLDLWNPIWADALIQFHPEYRYQMYQEKLCSQIVQTTFLGTANNQNLSSEAYDSLLSNTDTYAVAKDELGMFTTNNSAINIFNYDPYFNITLLEEHKKIDLNGNGHLDIRVDKFRKLIMEYAITHQFENKVYDESTTNQFPLTMLQTAYITEMCTGVTSCYSASNPPPTNAEIITELGSSNLTELQKNKIWQNYKAYYFSFKQKIQYVFLNYYTSKKLVYNGCIDDVEPNETTQFYHHGSFWRSGWWYSFSYFGFDANILADSLIDNDYSENEEDDHVEQIIEEYNLPLPDNTSDNFDFCSQENSNIYFNKVKRFVNLDVTYNTDIGDESAIEQMESIADSELLIQTGRCPLAFDLEMFLDGLVNVTNDNDENLTLNNLTGYNYNGQFVTSGLFEAITNTTLENINHFNIESSLNGNVNTIIFNQFNTNTPWTGLNCLDNNNNPVILNLFNLPSGYSWSNYNPNADTSGSDGQWKVQNFYNLYYEDFTSNGSENTFNFKIVARVYKYSSSSTVNPVEEIIMSGTTCIPIGECFVVGSENNDASSNDVGQPILIEPYAEPGFNLCCNESQLEYDFEQNLKEIMNAIINDPNANLFSTTNINLNQYSAYTNGYLRDYFRDSSNTNMWYYDDTNIVIIDSAVPSNIVFKFTPSFPNNITEIEYLDINTISYPYRVTTSYYVNETFTLNNNQSIINTELEFICPEPSPIITCDKIAYEKGMVDLINTLISLNLVNSTTPININNLPIYHNATLFRETLGDFDNTPTYWVYENFIGNYQYAIKKNEDLLLGLNPGSDFTYNQLLLNYYIDYRDNSKDYPSFFLTVKNCNTIFTLEAKHRTNIVFNCTDGSNDIDTDGINNDMDNLPYEYNPDQAIPSAQSYPYSGSCEVVYYYPINGNSGLDSCDCIPQTVAPVSCTSKYNEFINFLDLDANGVSNKINGYVLPNFLALGTDEKDANGTTIYLLNADGTPQLDGNNNPIINNHANGIDDALDYFCGMNYGYLVDSYITYIETLNIVNTTDVNYLTLAEFGNTQLNYGFEEIDNVIYSFNEYITNFVPDNNNLGDDNPDNDAPEDTIVNLHPITWNEYANGYLVDHPFICPPIPMNTVWSFQVPTPPNDCREFVLEVSETYSLDAYNTYIASLKARFKNDYINQALNNVVENFTEEHLDKEYQYTLYYYDQAGNLIQTVPPEGVDRKTYTEAENNIIDNYRINPNTTSQPTDSEMPNHTLKTQYKYNSLNQLVWQKTPDGGITRFAYDDLGRIIASQNAKQVDLDNNQANQQAFSYTLYDNLGRITEAGQIFLSNELSISENGKLIETSSNPVIDFNIAEAINYRNSSSYKTEVSKTKYDDINPNYIPYFESYSYNSRGRVTTVEYYNFIESGIVSRIEPPANAILYDYDIHGNVKEIVRKINDDTFLKQHNQHIKSAKYEYDLISGNVNKVTYQKGKPDQFIHKYEYDADNRITNVKTSKDGVIWEKDATYNYYDHGPLARTVLGEHQVQGLDYAYTLQGWLKSVNSDRLSPDIDMGKDGFANSIVAKDAFAYALHYYEGDYSARQPSANNFINFGNTNQYNLYNGNIKSMVTSLLNHKNVLLNTSYNNYRYDQLNRIKEMNSEKITFNGVYNEGISSNYSFDRNGNLKTLQRTATYKDGTIRLMDDFEYKYNLIDGKLINNQLQLVKDNMLDTNRFSVDIDDQITQLASLGINYNPNSYIDNNGNIIESVKATHNYQYDKIGQLTRDLTEGIKNIEWTVSGKVSKITKNTGEIIEFKYDPLGNRLSKKISNPSLRRSKPMTTYYIRDAQGNVLSIYKKYEAENLTRPTIILEEQNIYGSSRVGLQQVNLDMMSVRREASTIETGRAMHFNANFEAEITDEHQFNFKDKESFNISAILELTMPTVNDTYNIVKFENQNLDSITKLHQIKLGVKYENETYKPQLVLRTFKDSTNIKNVVFTLDKNLKDKNLILNVDVQILDEINNKYDVVFNLGEKDNYIIDKGLTQEVFYEPYTTSHTTGVNKIADNSENSLDFKLDEFSYAINGTKRSYHFDKGFGDPVSSDGTKTLRGIPSDNWVFRDVVLRNYQRIIGDKRYELSNHLGNVLSVISDHKAISSDNGIVTNTRSFDRNTDILPWQAQEFTENVEIEKDRLRIDSKYNLNGVEAYYTLEANKTYLINVTVDRDRLKSNLEFGITYNNKKVLTQYIKKSGKQQFEFKVEETGDYLLDFAIRDGKKQYENAQTFYIDNFEIADISNRNLNLTTNNLTFIPEVLSYNDYYPFGMLVPNRNFSSPSYRYGFNGKEKDDEVKGSGMQYDYGFRIYDPRLGKFLSVDPLFKGYPWYTPYQFAGNKPIWAMDLDGLEELIMTDSFKEKFSSELEVIYESNLLSKKIDNISDPSKKDDIKIYFFVGSHGNANGFNTDIVSRANNIVALSSKGHVARAKISKALKKEIAESKRIFKEIGLDARTILKDAKAGKQFFGIGISAEKKQENGINNATQTIIHEIDAHLLNKLKGIEKSQVEEHIEFFGLDKKENKKIYEKYKKWILVGRSLRKEDIPTNSPAGIIKKEVEKTIKKINTNKELIFKAHKRKNRFEKSKN